MRRLLVSALLIAAALPTLAAEREAMRIDRNITFATLEDGREMMLDLYRPAEDTDGPLVVWVHGGGWMMGNRWPCPVAFLADHGYAVASISYRYAQQATFPAQLHDCKAAIRFLRANADDYGYNADRIGVIGASAGGHLAALLGTTGNDPDTEGDLGDHPDTSSAVQAVYDLFGPTDLADLDEDIPDDEENTLAAFSPITLLLGADPDDRPDLAAAADPAHYADADDPPFLIIHGTNDPLVPLRQSEYLAEKLEAVGVEHRLVVIEEGGHGGWHYQTEERIAELLVFLGEHLVEGDE
jgi:acetyl esterase/lipase